MHSVTEKELKAHLALGHLAASDTYDELKAYVGGCLFLSKLGLIIKARNGVEKARMILDAKESGIKHVTAKSQRVILPPLFDAVLRMLKMKALAETQGKDVSQFVLDYSDAFWQIPICPDELQFFCATAIIDGKRQYLVF